ncbi:MAG: DUF4241 domain-containing protein [Selenomonadaceae bacterium]|nr:DUF4241 domain-containing protein [Selenomonadaceae bacterium]
MKKKIKLGTFNVMENKIVVADPSYDFCDFGTLILSDVLEGKYFADITTADKFVTSLNICHSDYKNIELNFSLYGEIFVDSGQAGFFDKKYFVENQGGTFSDITSFYGLACAITMSPKQAGTMKRKGVVSSSGFGDGFYRVFVGRNFDRKIVSAKIIFVSEQELEEMT